MHKVEKKDAVKTAVKTAVVKNPDPKPEAEKPAKKTKEEKAAERAAAKQSTVFELTETLPNFKKGGQVELIVESLKKLKTGTIDQITEAIKDKLTTRQDPKQVVSFYMTQMKKAGQVRVVEKKAA